MHSIGWVSVRLQVHAPTEYLWVIKLHKVHLVCYEMMGSDIALVPDRALLYSVAGPAFLSVIRLRV